MPEKSASIAQQRLLGMAWAARTGRLDTKKIDDEEWRKKVEKIAKSKNFSDKTLHKMASTKYKDEKTGKLRPYLIGKGTPENPEKKRRPYKKRATAENLQEDIISENVFSNFYDGYCEALSIMEDKNVPSKSKVKEALIANMINSLGAPYNKIGGTLPVKHLNRIASSKDFSSPDDELLKAQVERSRMLL